MTFVSHAFTNWFSALLFTKVGPAIVKFIAVVAEFIAVVVEFIAKVVEFVAKVVEFIAKVVEFIAKVVEFIAKVVEFIAKVVKFELKKVLGILVEELYPSLAISVPFFMYFTSNDNVEFIEEKDIIVESTEEVVEFK
jgi:hypothetical protein